MSFSLRDTASVPFYHDSRTPEHIYIQTYNIQYSLVSNLDFTSYLHTNIHVPALINLTPF